MKKSEIIATVLRAVEEETGIDIKILVSLDKHREVVDARHIAINLLHEHGIYVTNIATVFNATARNIRHALSYFDTRITFSPPMKHDYERIGKSVRDSCETA